MFPMGRGAQPPFLRRKAVFAQRVAKPLQTALRARIHTRAQKSRIAIPLRQKMRGRGHGGLVMGKADHPVIGRGSGLHDLHDRAVGIGFPDAGGPYRTADSSMRGERNDETDQEYRLRAHGQHDCGRRSPCRPCRGLQVQVPVERSGWQPELRAATGLGQEPGQYDQWPDPGRDDARWCRRRA